MNSYSTMALVLAALAVCLLFSVDTILPPSVNNDMLKKIRDQHMVVGGLVLCVAYYCHTLGEQSTSRFQSYGDSTEAALNM